MTLDLDLFRTDKGGDPEKMKLNQKNRFKDVKLVETVIDEDAKWRRFRYLADLYNRLKNQCSKAIGEKMKKKEEVGATDLNDNIVLEEVNVEFMQTLSLGQLKALRVKIEEGNEKNSKDLEECEKTRTESLREVGNILHSSVPVDDNEDNNRVERTWGDCTSRKKYSHVDLIVVRNKNE